MKNNKSVYESFVLIMQFGINMIVPILLCTALGVWISDKTGHPIIVVPLFIMGALAGFRNIYIMAKRVYERDNNKERRPKQTLSNEKFLQHEEDGDKQDAKKD